MPTRFAPRLRTSLATIVHLLAASTALAVDVADLILVDATVITADPAVPRAQAIAIKDGRILAVGGIDQALAFKGEATRVRDLDGQVVVPGFIDPHGSCLAAGLRACAADLSDIAAEDHAAWSRTLQSHAKAPLARRVGVVLGTADDGFVAAISRERLDEAVGDLPAIVIGASGRSIVLNSKAGDLTGGDVAAGGVLHGERAHAAMLAVLASRQVESMATVLLAGQELLASRGYTTVAEADVDDVSHAAFVRLAAARRMAIDVVAFAETASGSAPAFLVSPWKSSSYANGYRVAGVCVAFDRELVDTLDEASQHAGRTLDATRARDVIVNALDSQWQIMSRAHSEESIAAVVTLLTEVGASRGPTDRRTILVGADLARPEHFAMLAEPRIGIAFGPGRLVLDGDRLRDSMADPADAERLASAATALSHRVPVAFHSSVGLADPLQVMQAAVGRRTSSGDILGSRERLPVDHALAGITRGAAFVLGEDGAKGSIEAGKQADLVILSGDPLKVGPAGLAELRVLETIKAGRIIHDQTGSSRPVRRRPGAWWVVTP